MKKKKSFLHSSSFILPPFFFFGFIVLLMSACRLPVAAQRAINAPQAAAGIHARFDPYTPHVPPRAIAYQRANYALALIGIAWHLIGLWLLLRSGLSAAIRTQVFRITHRMPPQSGAPPPFAALALFFAVFTLLMLVWMLPIGLADLNLEWRYGFSRESVPLFLRDALIGMVYEYALIPVLWAGYWLYARSPHRWWLWLWALTVPLLFFQMVLEPVVVAPAYNRFAPLAPGRLRDRILALAARAHITGAHIYVADTSRRTTHVNAYVTGWGPTTRIVIDDTALKELPEDQILAMVGHEMGHYVEGHIWIGFLSSCVGAWLFLWLAARLLPWLIRIKSGRYHLQGVNDLAALPLILLTLYLFINAQFPMANAESRYLEHRADAFGLRLTHLNDAMARLFVGFAERDYSDPDPPLLFQGWFGTHPTLKSRIAFALHYHPWKHE